ncbi:MAG: formate dehydrogenase accessory sulfurtransferase FdhD [Bacteroidota bacterium]
MQDQLKSANILKFKDGQSFPVEPDLLAVEEPLEIRIGYGPVSRREQKSLSVTMRTPGHDHELALGFLFTEGIIQSFNDIEGIRHCEEVGKEERGNIIRIELKPFIHLDFGKLERHFYTTSSCGVCGKSSLEAISISCSVINSKLKIQNEHLTSAPDKLRSAQKVFTYTGGIHATGLFNGDGELIMLREDVGRHNAFDKLVGACLMKGLLPLDTYFILVSGRVSFELVQKAVRSGVPLLAAIGAPSTLAVELAERFEQTLIGFLKPTIYNVYNASKRIVF